jgi:hypothetical protein
MGMIDGYVERILKARVYDVVDETPLEAAPRLSERFGNRVFVKREDLHSVFRQMLPEFPAKRLVVPHARRHRFDALP